MAALSGVRRPPPRFCATNGSAWAESTWGADRDEELGCRADGVYACRAWTQSGDGVGKREKMAWAGMMAGRDGCQSSHMAMSSARPTG